MQRKGYSGEQIANILSEAEKQEKSIADCCKPGFSPRKTVPLKQMIEVCQFRMFTRRFRIKRNQENAPQNYMD